MHKPAWLGPEGESDLLTIDYSRFKPRGFYTASDTLSGYFRAVGWLQAIYTAQAGFGDRIIFIRFMFGNMNVKTALLRRSFPAGLQRIFRQCEVGMQTESRRHTSIGNLFGCTALYKANILLNSGARLLLAVAVRNFIAQNCTHTGLITASAIMSSDPEIALGDA